MWAQRLTQRGRQVTLDHVEEDAGDGILPVEELLERVARRYAGRVEFVGVDVQDTEQNARTFLSRYGVTYPNGPDPSGQISIDYGMSGVPESYFVGRDGRIARKWAGPLDEPKLVGFVEELLR